MEKVNFKVLRNIVIVLIIFEILVIGGVYLNIKGKKSNIQSIDNTAGNEMNRNDVESSDKETVENDIPMNETESMEEIYKMAILGSYKTEEGLIFKFYDDGLFSGFFDNKNKEVENYKYSVLYSDNMVQLKIINPKDESAVLYYLTFDKDGNAVLTYPDNGAIIVLKTIK